MLQVNDTLRFNVTLEDEVRNEDFSGSNSVTNNNLVQVLVSVIIVDVNDNPPVFRKVS